MERFCPPCSIYPNCGNCHHASDVPLNRPIKFMAWRDHWIDALIVGKNNDGYYVKEGESISHVGFDSKLIK